MSREAASTITKSKMELSATKCNGQSLTFVTETPTPDSTGVLDTLRCFVKICLYYLQYYLKLNEIIKLYIK